MSDEPCVFFASPSGCKFGAACRFAHISQPTDPQPNESSGDRPKRNRRKKKPKQNPSESAINQQQEHDQQQTAESDSQQNTNQQRQPSQVKPLSSRPAVRRPVNPRINQSTDPLERARIARELEINQLQRRFSSTHFETISNSSKKPTTQNSETVIQLHLVPSDPDFPFDLNALRIRLSIPESYPTNRLCPITIMNTEIPPIFSRTIERAWMHHMQSSKHGLLEGLNWLDRNLESLLVPKTDGIVVSIHPADSKHRDESADHDESAENKSNPDLHETDSDLDSESVDEISGDLENVLDLDGASNASDNDNQDLLAEQTTAQDTSAVIPKQRGTQIRLPSIRLDSISLLHCTSMSLTIRCKRCKNNTDIHKLVPNTETASNQRTSPCNSCGTLLSVSFRRDFVHMNSSVLGYLDLENATAFDLLPSSYTATCGACQTSEYMFTSLPVCTLMTVHCRGCHNPMSIDLGQVKFHAIGSGGGANGSKSVDMLPRKQKHNRSKDPLEQGIVVGMPLPDRGTCEHYRKSYRWFRFPCCGRLYPCDVCHELASTDGHVLVRATRMICGYCSREQSISGSSQSDIVCACGRLLIKKMNTGAGSAFWEGGKGTRDRTRMRRNDSKKYSGLGKTTSKSSVSVKSK